MSEKKDPGDGHGLPFAQPPLESGIPLISMPKVSAGGLPAVLSSLKHMNSEMGLLRGIKGLFRVNQKTGFDCPGCAWPDPDLERTSTEFCENGAKAVAEEATTKKVTSAVFEKWSVRQLSELSDHEIGKLGRLTEPMVLKAGAAHYERISWDEAFQLIARELNAVATPDEAVFYTSGRTSNEAAFLYQLFIRLYGTNNLPDCSNMCHESSGVALMETIGVGKGTVKLEDFERADLIIVIGQNPGTNHPRMLTALQAAVRSGCRIMSINPLLESGIRNFKHPQEFWTWIGKGTPLVSMHLPVRINGDVPLLKGIMKEILLAEEEKPGSVLDLNFIQSHTAGFEAFARDLQQTSWETVVAESGIRREEIREAARLIMKSRRVICCWAMGLTQHRNAVANIQEIVNLLLLGGHLGREGAGACPVRGHSNVQGDRTMGIYEKPSVAFLEALGREFKFTPPARHGLDTVDAIHAMLAGKVRVFFGMGGNFLSATPDTEQTARALGRCELTVHVSTKLNRAHLVTGRQALILPCLGRTERDRQAAGEQVVTVENSMGIVHTSQGRFEPASTELRSEVAIVAGLAQAVFRSVPQKLEKVDWAGLQRDYGRIRDHIARVVPGFDDFNARLRGKDAFYLPNAVRDSRTFATSTGKANFTVHAIEPVPLPEGRFLLMTIRSHDQFNTTIYGLNDRYRGITAGRRVVLMNREDMKRSSLHDGMTVDITSHFGEERRTAKRFMVVPYDIPEKCVAAYFPEANVLVPLGAVAEKSNTPAYKSIIVSLAAAP